MKKAIIVMVMAVMTIGGMVYGDIHPKFNDKELAILACNNQVYMTYEFIDYMNSDDEYIRCKAFEDGKLYWVSWNRDYAENCAKKEWQAMTIGEKWAFKYMNG